MKNDKEKIKNKTDELKKIEFKNEKIKLLIEIEKYRFNECHGGC